MDEIYEEINRICIYPGTLVTASVEDSGADVGAVHRRDRIWIVASNNSQVRFKRNIEKQIPQFTPFPWGKDVRGIEDLRNRPDLSPSIIWRKDYGMADYVDRVSAIGNGQIPRVAATAWRVLNDK